MRFCTRMGITLISSSLLLSGCSNHDLTLNSPAQYNTRPRLLETRTNPLQNYIETNWPSSVTGGSHYENIKIYGHSYDPLGPTDADFIANHFDVYMGGGDTLQTEASLDNSSMLCLGEGANVPHVRAGWDSLQVVTFLATANPNNYTFDDLLLHYAVNTSTYVVHMTPGWNPADDNDGDGCIEAGEGLNHNGQPSDPNRSAQCIQNSRVRNAISVVNGVVVKRWLMANPASQAYIDFRAWYANYEWSHGAEGLHFDEVSYQNPNIHFDNLLEYANQDPTSSSFSYISDKYAFVPSVMSQVEGTTGPAVALGNVVDSDHLCGSGSYLGPQHDLAYDNLENVLLEEWMPSLASVDTTKVERMLQCPLTDFLEQGKGVVFTYREDNSQGRLFSLCMFYMINHQTAFYYYTKQGHSGLNAATGQWNPWVEYNVGQPSANDLGRNDFQGNSGTDKFFVFASGATYRVLGREYFRDSDEAVILVLAKVMAPGQTWGTSATTIQLGDHYRVIQPNFPNFSLSASVTSVSLKNNEGVILIRANTGNGSGGCHCTPQG